MIRNKLEQHLITILAALGDSEVCPEDVEDKLEWYLIKIEGSISQGGGLRFFLTHY